jgi:sigma-B regulation protein RsbQ
MDILKRNNVVVTGNRDAATTLIFAHGFGCDQNMWRLVAPHFEDRFRMSVVKEIGTIVFAK